MILTDLPVEYMDAFDPPSPDLSDEDRARLGSNPVGNGWQQYTRGDTVTTWAEPIEPDDYGARLRLSVSRGPNGTYARVEVEADAEPCWSTEYADDLRALARELDALADLMEGET